jgi:predicted enzyme related to lactoylglutathione lyase
VEQSEQSIYYLEIVTPDVDSMCNIYSKAAGLQFGEAIQALGNARTAKLPGGTLMGIRAPMHESETPVVRPYLLVTDIEQAGKDAAAFGANILLAGMEIPGYGIITIYESGGIQHGLWQLV